jgi:hypothetical protein
MAKKLNRRHIVKLVSESSVYKSQINNIISKKVLRSKRGMLEEFDSHPVTREVEAGINSGNTSGTLPSGYGNLYTFIGFRYGSDPANMIRNLLSLTKSLKKTKSKVSKSKITTYFTITTPSQDQIKAVSKMPFEGGKSWVYGIERGISGFSHYIYKNYTLSRSTKGLQSRYKARSGQFKPMYDGYITRILKNFFDRVSK